MTPYIHPSQKAEKTIYDLYAIVEHSGVMSGGHYVAYVKQLKMGMNGKKERGDWFNISDSHVKKMSVDQVMTMAQPYILFYEQRK